MKLPVRSEESPGIVELADQIRRRRTEKGLSQEELAKAIFVSRQTISNWQTNRTYPDVESLLLLSRLFGISADELIGSDTDAMRRIVHDDAQKLRWLSWAATISTVLGIVFFVGLSAAWSDRSGVEDLSKGNMAGAAIFVPLWAIGLGTAVAAERLKRKHDLVTYREIIAFAQREEVPSSDDASFARTHPLLATAAKFLLGAAIGAFLGVLIYKFVFN